MVLDVVRLSRYEQAHPRILGLAFQIFFAIRQSVGWYSYNSVYNSVLE